MQALYDGGMDAMVQRISEIDEEVSSLLVVGHSPTIPMLAADLLAANDQQRADDLLCHYPTATVTALEVEGPWSQLGEHPIRAAR